MRDLDKAKTESYSPLLYKGFSKDNLPDSLTLRVSYGPMFLFGVFIISLGLLAVYASYLNIQKGEDVFRACLGIILFGGFSIFMLLCLINPTKMT